MYILTVIPIKKGLQKEYLTYFSAKNIPLGSIVSAPLRQKFVDAIVIDIENAEDLKSEIKNKKYELKKINEIKGYSPFSYNFLKSCEKMKYYTNSNTGLIIDSLLPKIFLENLDKLNIKKDNKTNDDNNEVKPKNEKLIFQNSFEDRIGWYKTLIRESFAKKESILIITPTIYDTEIFGKELSKGIENYVYILNGDIPSKNILTSYNKIVTESHPILIISTPVFLSIPRNDIKTIILEKENSPSYKQIKRPFIDIRSFIEIFSSINGNKLIIGDTILRPETLHRHDKGELGEITSPSFRLKEAKKQILVDMKKEFEEKKNKKFEIFGDDVKQIIESGIKNKESIFIYTNRKGLAPVTVCNDCGHTLNCPFCSTPIVLYGTKQMTANIVTTKRIFMCNKCGKKETTEIRCPLCDSWNLTPLGIGTDRIREELEKLFSDAKIYQIDKENTTDKEAKNIIKDFEKNKGSILIGTEMAFSYIHNEVDHSIIVSIDGLLSIPSFNITQKILQTILKLQNITKSNLVIQTRNIENVILNNIINGNILTLIRQDLKEREFFNYPPFKKIIKITFIGNKIESEKAKNYLEKILQDYDPQIFSAFIGKIKGEFVTNTIIKIDPNIWPLPTSDKNIINEDLAFKLSSLPFSFSVNIDPEDLL